MRGPPSRSAERLSDLRGLLRRGRRFSFEDAVAGADRMTVCVTLYALLELYKRGEADWEQDEPFGAITVAPSPTSPGAVREGRMNPLARTVEALLFLSADPVSVDELAGAARPSRGRGAALEELGGTLDGTGLVLRGVGGGWTLATHPDAEEAARRLLAKPRTPPLTPAQSETLAVVAYLQPVSRPEIARIRGVVVGLGGLRRCSSAG